MSAGRFPDPWPSRQPSWPPPPWIMSGTVLTAWFDLPREQVARLISPSLLPSAGTLGPSRLRFYELDYHAESDPTPDAERRHSARPSSVCQPPTRATVGEISASHMERLRHLHALGTRRVRLADSPRARPPQRRDLGRRHPPERDGGTASSRASGRKPRAITVDAIERRPSRANGPRHGSRRVSCSSRSRNAASFSSSGRYLPQTPATASRVRGNAELAFREPHPLAGLGRRTIASR